MSYSLQVQVHFTQKKVLMDKENYFTGKWYWAKTGSSAQEQLEKQYKVSRSQCEYLRDALVQAQLPETPRL